MVNPFLPFASTLDSRRAVDLSGVLQGAIGS
jgi:hypothetical protein